jgi:hypothetical protein
MPINIKPEISLGIKPPTVMTLPEMLNFVRGQQLYQRESEILPEQIQQAKIQTQQAQFQLNRDQTANLMGLVGGYRNDPRISSGDSNQTREALSEIRAKAIASGLPADKVDELMRMGNMISERNPTKLPQYFDNVIQSQISAESRQGLRTPQPISGLPGPAVMTPGTGEVRPMNIVPAAPAPAAAPAAATPAAAAPAFGSNAAPAAAPPAAPVAAPEAAPAAAPTMTPTSGPGFALPFQPRRAGDVRPFAPGEEAARIEGEGYYKKLADLRSRAPSGMDRVDRVLQTIEKIESDRLFKAGKAGELESRLRSAFGDADYKLLEKEIADLVIATNQAIGGKTDATTELVSQSMGNTSFPPGVLKNIATKLRADAFGAMLQSRGAEKFLEAGYGESNLARGYRAAWDANADPRVLEGMAIFASDRLSPAEKIKAYEKIKPTNLQALEEFEQKALNLKSLSETGRLPPPRKPR